MSKAKLAIVALIISNVIWGAAAPIFKWSLHDIHPFTLAFLRFFIPLILIVVLSPREIPIKSKDFPLFLLAGISGITINIGAFFLGIERTASINSPIISSSGPVFILLGSILFLQERPSKKMLLGNLIGLTGVLLIILEPLMHNNSSSSLLGNFFLIIATFGAVGGTLSVKKLAKKYDALTITFWTFLIGTLSFAPFSLSEITSFGLSQMTQFPSIIGILFGSLLSSFLAYSIYYWALKHVLASQTTVFTYMDPVVAILIAAPLIHEYPTPLFFAGSLMVFLGMFLAEGKIHYHPFHLLFKRM